jgi:hypothetical protein
MTYCPYDYGQNQYFCDIDGKYYGAYKDCFNSCVFKINDVSVHMSAIDMTFLFAFWGMLLGVLFFFAFHISHD